MAAVLQTTSTSTTPAPANLKDRSTTLTLPPPISRHNWPAWPPAAGEAALRPAPRPQSPAAAHWYAAMGPAAVAGAVTVVGAVLRWRQRLWRQPMLLGGGAGGPAAAAALSVMALPGLPRHRTLDGSLELDAFPISGGAYGCVYGGAWRPAHDAGPARRVVAKRAWSAAELRGRQMASPGDTERHAARCRLFWGVEHHCAEKLAADLERRCRARPDEIDAGTLCVAPYLGTFETKDQQWIVWNDIGGTDSYRGQTLLDLLKDAHARQLKDPAKDPAAEDTLALLAQRLRWPTGRDEAARRLLEQLLEGVVCCHRCGVVHRDVKPGNLLLDEVNGTIRLIDFGSAADLEPSNGVSAVLASFGLGNGGRVGFDSESADVSPVYAAPEVFPRPDPSAASFDVFSVAMVFLQVLFPNLADERSMAAFRQQLEAVSFDLERWLELELEATILPKGVSVGLRYLAHHHSVWQLLGRMLTQDPRRRISSTEALASLRLAPTLTEVLPLEEESFLEVVMENSDTGPEPSSSNVMLMRPLSIITSFSREQPVGLALATKFDDWLARAPLPPPLQALWDEGTRDASPADVFVREIIPGGQADRLGVLQVGDRLQMVGDLDVSSHGGGCKRARRLMDMQPRTSRELRLLFRRRPLGTGVLESATTVSEAMADPPTPEPPCSEEDLLQTASPQRAPGECRVADCGAWTIQGRRGTQEDTFVLTHLRSQTRELYIAGVFDGHAGPQASQLLADSLPALFAQSLQQVAAGVPEVCLSTLRQALSRTWKEACNAYLDVCPEKRLADYDPRTGRVAGFTSGDDLAAGSTAVVAVVAEERGAALLLNCGDSRAVLAARRPNGWAVDFATRDHTPGDEAEQRRLKAGRAAGLNFGDVYCELGCWRVEVLEYVYAVSRSLEGPIAASKGIISTPDIEVLEGLGDGADRILCVASDGLWGVADPDAVVRLLGMLRDAGYPAEYAARHLSQEVLKVGSRDNITCVVLYL
eukprot:EG_transcript_1539